MNKLDWYGLYNESWQGEITPEAFSHPAKFSRGLIRQIYQHMIDEGYIKAGDHIADPFGGVGLGALEAMRHGMHWHGKELEPRFVELGNQNIGLWNARYKGWFPVWGTAVLVQGDSRYFSEGMGMADGAISSPPYAELGNGVKSGAVDNTSWSNGKERKMGRSHHADGYGTTPGQLGSMPAGDFAAAISSPPYGDAINATTSGIDWDKAGRPDRLKPSDARNNTMTDGVTKYGTTPGNLGNMPYDAAVSSPPFENSLDNIISRSDDGKDNGAVATFQRTGKWPERRPAGLDYGSTSGNIGNATGATFWTASRIIVEQIYSVLKPGGVAAWVCGNFVRKGEIVDFGGQWLALCESVGFVAHTHAVAWKTEYNGNQLDIFGGDNELRTDRVSFFRRLANQKNPDSAILNEDVIFVRKPS